MNGFYCLSGNCDAQLDIESQLARMYYALRYWKKSQEKLIYTRCLQTPTALPQRHLSTKLNKKSVVRLYTVLAVQIPFVLIPKTIPETLISTWLLLNVLKSVSANKQDTRTPAGY